MICDVTENLDIRKLRRLDPAFPEVFLIDGERIVTEWTKTQFGGRRQWFLCPSCDRRCAIIYRVGNGTLWCCRVCGDGRYWSERQTQNERLLSQAIKVRASLGQTSGGIIPPFPKRPKHMRKKKYEALRARAILRELDYTRRLC